MDNLRQLQLIELDILKRVLEICSNHDLTYYMLGGTLLGAVRHHGFIPWDDDIDIGLPRPDYEKLLLFANKELDTPYQLHTLHNKNGLYSYYYARIENTEKRIIRASGYKKAEIPVWVDVFPLDGVPNDEKTKKIWLRKCSVYNALFKASQFSYRGGSSDVKKKRSIPKKIARQMFITFKLENLISTEWAWKKLDNALKENDYNSCDSLINYCGRWGVKELFPKSVYGQGKLYSFENLVLNGPEDYDTVLTQMYGDYMTPPPEDKQNQHHIELL